MDEEENGAPSEELRNRALALQLQLSLGEQAEEATAPDPYEGLEDRVPPAVRRFDEFLAANIPGARAAGEFAAETLDALVLDYLPKTGKTNWLSMALVFLQALAWKAQEEPLQGLWAWAFLLLRVSRLQVNSWQDKLRLRLLAPD